MIITNESAKLIKDWQRTKKQAVNARQNYLSSLKSREAAKRKLADWLLPKDAKVGEKFCIWYGDSLIQVSIINEGPPRVVSIMIRHDGEAVRAL